MKKTVFPLVLILLAVSASGDDVTTAASIINDLFCKIVSLLFLIAPAIGAIIITLEGIKWIASSEDAGARKKAKEGIIHVFVGLIIVLLAIPLVTLVIVGADQFYQCVSYVYTPSGGSTGGGAGSSTGGSGTGGSTSGGSGASSGDSSAGGSGTGGSGTTGSGTGGSSTGGTYVGVAGPYGSNFITSLNLREGWNLISTPIALDNPNVSTAFNDLPYDIIYSWNASSKNWDYYLPGYGGNLTYVEVDRGYWIHLANNATIVLHGKSPYPIRNVSLVAGWNLVGFSGYNPLPVALALNGVEYVYVFGWNSTQALDSSYGIGWSFTSPDSVVHQAPPKPPIMTDPGFKETVNLTIMEQGRAYWIYVENSTYWIYNTNYPA